MSIDREGAIKERIAQVLEELGYQPRAVDLRRIPFSGAWGAAHFGRQGPGRSGRRRRSGPPRPLIWRRKRRRRAPPGSPTPRPRRSPNGWPRNCSRSGAADRVEAVNGFVNIYFDTASVAAQTVGRVLAEGTGYGQGTGAGRARDGRVLAAEHP